MTWLRTSIILLLLHSLHKNIIPQEKTRKRCSCTVHLKLVFLANKINKVLEIVTSNKRIISQSSRKFFDFTFRIAAS